MATLNQTEQTTPSPPGANTQLLYPKVGGQFIMAADGIEKQILDARSLAAAIVHLNTNINLTGGL